jgi:hypothetical protein
MSTPHYLSHFQALLVFALCISVAAGFLSGKTMRRRLMTALQTFVLFVAIAVALAWILYPFTH